MKKYGLVLEGGGARGSYQIGACKALHEAGVEVGAVAGTSIGALNGALIVQDQIDKAHDLWYNISPSKVFDIDEDRLDEVKNFKISHDGLIYFMKMAKSIAQSKGLDITFIKKLLKEIIDEEKLRNSKMKFGFITVSLTDMKPLELFLEDIPEGKIVEYLLAGANLPAFKQEKLDGRRFLDGAFYDNLPINMLVRLGYKDIIAIRTKALGIKRKITDPDVSVEYISTNDNLGGILDFNNNQARINLELGYYDALRFTRGLRGRKYYIEATNDEERFIKFLLAPGEKAIMRLGESLGIKGMPFRRVLFEYLIPKLAAMLNLGRESSYEDIVIGILEIIAQEGDVERFRIYSITDFFSEIKMKRSTYYTLPAGEIHLPPFIRHSDVLSRAVKDRILREWISEWYKGTVLLSH